MRAVHVNTKPVETADASKGSIALGMCQDCFVCVCSEYRVLWGPSTHDPMRRKKYGCGILAHARMPKNAAPEGKQGGAHKAQLFCIGALP